MGLTRMRLCVCEVIYATYFFIASNSSFILQTILSSIVCIAYNIVKNFFNTGLKIFYETQI